MRRVYRHSNYWQPAEPYQLHSLKPYPRPSSSGFGYLLVASLSVFYIALIAYGSNLLTGIPFFICLIFAGILFAMKMYFLRRQPPLELSVNTGWDKVVGYLVTLIVSIVLAAYGLYGLSSQIRGSSDTQSKIMNPEQSHNSPIAKAFSNNLSVGGRKNDYITQKAWTSESELIRYNSVIELNNDPAQVVNENAAGASITDSSLKKFTKDTLSQSSYAMGCWILSAIIEALILILVIYLRPKYSYWE